MKKLSIGIIGYGSWTKKALIPALNRDGRAEIISIAAPSQKTRRRIQSDLGNQVEIYDEIESLIAGLSIDGIMIAVPDSMHETTLLRALESGIPVFYEPPVTDRRERIIPVVQALLSAKQITYADLELGLTPVVERASELVQSQHIGRIQTASIRLQSGWGSVPHYDLCNFNHLCTWYVDVLNRILAAAPIRVLLLDGRGTPGRRQSHNIAHLDYHGVWGTFQINISCVGKLEIVVEINGDDGDIILDLWQGEIRYRNRENTSWSVEKWPAISPYAGWPGVHESVSAFLSAVENKRSSINSADTVVKLQLVGLAAEKSKDGGGWIDIEDPSIFFAEQTASMSSSDF